jgi:hypothetical protein
MIRAALPILFIVAMTGITEPDARARENNAVLAKADRDNCDDIDLQEPKNSPLRKMPVLDQDSTGACYAYAGSVLLDYQRLKKNPKAKPSNPLQMALLTRLDDSGGLLADEKDTWGGLIEDSINARCIVDIPRIRRSRSPRSRTVYSNTAWSLGSLRPCLRGILTMRRGVSTIYNASIKHGGCTAETSKARFNELRAVLGENLTDANIIARLEIYLNETTTSSGKPRSLAGTEPCDMKKEREALQEFMKSKGLHPKLALEMIRDLFQECRKSKLSFGKLPKAENYSRFSDEDASKAFNLLLKEQIPVGLSIASPVLRDPTERCVTVDPVNQDRAVAPNHPACKEGSKDPHFMHAVALIGQKKINDECHYLIRNSWGGSWRAKGANGKPAQCSCNRVKNIDDNKPIYHSVCPEEEANDVVENDGVLDLDAPFAESYPGCWIPRRAILGNLNTFTVAH